VISVERWRMEVKVFSVGGWMLEVGRKSKG